MDTFRQDIRFALRMLMKSKAFTVFTIATLALGIGANTALFTVVNGMLLRPLPYSEPDQLVDVMSNADQPFSISQPNLIDWQRGTRTLRGLAGYTQTSVNLTGAGDAEHVDAIAAGDAFFTVLGVAAMRGRTWNESDPSDNGVVMSDGLWRRRFGADTEIIGRTILVNGAERPVIGVMPPSFRFGSAELWLRLPVNPEARRGNFNLSGVARLADDVPISIAQQEMDAIGKQLLAQYPNNGLGALLRPLHTTMVSGARRPLYVLLGACGLVLLIACVNVASLMLARSEVRRREMAVRASLGAMRGRLIRQLLTESVLLSMGAGAIGLLLATWGTDLLLGLIPGALPGGIHVGVDARVVGFALVVALGTGILFGLVPAWRSSDLRLSTLMREGGRGSTAGSGRQRARNALIVAEIALALIPLAGAGLLMRSLGHLLAIDTGFQAENVLIANYSLPQRSYPDVARVAQFVEQLVAEASRLPGVQHAGVIAPEPFGDDDASGSFDIEARPLPSGVDARWTAMRAATPDYFQAAGIPLVRGRGFTAADRENTTRVALVDQAFVRKFFGGQNPIGHRIVMGFDKEHPREIIGVVGSVKHESLEEELEPQIYFPFAQQSLYTAAVFVRTTGAPTNLSDALRVAARAVDAQIPLYRIRTLDQSVRSSLARPRFTAVLLITFAICALLIAATGVYGVLSYMVIERKREIGIRVALGAQQQQILQLVVGQGARLAVLGVSIGIVGALALGSTLRGLLYETAPNDAVTLASVGAIVTAVALLACYLPARRAARLDPAETLTN